MVRHKMFKKHEIEIQFKDSHTKIDTQKRKNGKQLN